MNTHLEKLTVLANRSTPARRKAEAMGFKFEAAEVVYNPHDCGYAIQGIFSCVCGQRERYLFAYDEIAVLERPDVLDPAMQLFRAGSFSREHLLKDGFTPEQVDEIIRKGEEFRDVL